MNMKISFPEAEKMGWSYEEVYIFAFSELDYLTTELQKLHNSDGINDLLSYILRLIKKMLDTWRTIFLIYSDNYDYVSSCILCRNIVDNLATIYHIYMDSNEDEKWFKHYLYVLDGILCRYKDYPDCDQLVNNGRISENEFAALIAQVEETNKSDMLAKEFIIQQLKTNPLYQDNQVISDIINNGNWRYKSLNISYKKGEKNQYSWNALYKKLNPNPYFSAYASYLSVFVHGLSISNINLDDYDGLFEPILSLSIINMNLTSTAIKKIYKEDIELYNIDFKQSETMKSFIYSTSSEYLQKIKKHLKKEN